MKGVGYGHPEFSHGTYHGGDAQTSEEYDLSAIDDSKNLHIQAVCSCQMEGELGAREGVGVLEQLILGPHAPSGFVGLGDLAKYFFCKIANDLEAWFISYDAAFFQSAQFCFI